MGFYFGGFYFGEYAPLLISTDPPPPSSAVNRVVQLIYMRRNK